MISGQIIKHAISHFECGDRKMTWWLKLLPCNLEATNLISSNPPPPPNLPAHGDPGNALVFDPLNGKAF